MCIRDRCVANEPMPKGFSVGAMGESTVTMEELNRPGKNFLETEIAVSYTHLTLPTSDLV